MTRLSMPITDDDHRLGDPDASVTLVEYGDYECPFCAAAHPIAQGCEVRTRSGRSDGARPNLRS